MSTWLYAAPVVVAVAGLLVWLRFKWHASKVPYAALPGGIGTYFIAPGGAPVTPERISDALQMAVRCMAKVWPAQAVASVAKQCAVFVRAEPVSWPDGQGRQVAGQLIGSSLVVARNLSALAHELAHLLRRELDERFEEEHEGWGSRGIDAAVAEYQRWLTGGRA